MRTEECISLTSQQGESNVVDTDTMTLSSPVSMSEREQLYEEVNNLRAEKEKMIQENENFLIKFGTLSMKHLRSTPDVCVMLTGLTIDILEKLLLYLCEHLSYDGKTKLSLCENLILLTIVKLKQNLSFELLAYIANISKSTLVDHFWKWIDIMYSKLKLLVRMQDRDYIYKNIPPVFKKKFARLTSIIDCFEVFVEAPSSLLARAQFYSQYKKHCTVKVLISCTPLGAINFVSKCYGGRASDIQITRESEFHLSKYHMPGDQILADRGFTLRDDFAAGSSSELIVPAFTKGKKQLPAKDVEDTRKIASVRIHIERVIGLLRNRFTILKGTLPLRIIKNIKDEAESSTLANCDKIVTVCAGLTNLGESIVCRDVN